MTKHYTATEVALRQAVFYAGIADKHKSFEYKLNKMLDKIMLRTLTNYGSVTDVVCLRLKLK